ncbi:MAG TPA: hypothetical protein VMB49_04470 [Acidobacteriaceae bacterium]|nr:hypothetical protein [Acidobacteriaceae bacterium]
MKILCAAAILLAGCLSASGQSEAACGQTLEAPLRPRAVLTIDSRPAGLEIVGTDEPFMHVSCSSDSEEGAEPIRLRFSGNQDDGKLSVAGGSFHTNNLHIRIEVPRKTNLKVLMSAGQVKVEEVAGDKDIDIYAGQITISSDRLWDYRRVDVSVTIGQVRAQVYGADKGGFFRSFTKQTSDGEYCLRAHVTTGQIELLGSHKPEAAE